MKLIASTAFAESRLRASSENHIEVVEVNAALKLDDDLKYSY